jgi:hypothetical protein
MKGIDITGAHLAHVPGWLDEWVGGWVGVWMELKAILRIAYSNQKSHFALYSLYQLFNLTILE